MEAVTEVDLLDATLWNRIGYLFEEMSPTVKLQEGEEADMPLGLSLLLSYDEKMNRNDGNSSSGDPSSIVRGYVREKLMSELPGDDIVFVEDGVSLHSHSPIYIPGTRAAEVVLPVLPQSKL